MRYRGGLGVLCAFCLPIAAIAADEIAPYRFAIQQGPDVLELPYSRTHPLDVANADVERAIIVIHRGGSGSQDSLDRMSAAAALAGETVGTLIIAPQFLEEPDLDEFSLGSEVLYWNGWRHGHLSSDTAAHPRPFRVSTYTVVDDMVATIANPAVFPNLKMVVFAGFGAGGQFTNRYAAGSPVEDAVLHPLDIDVRYIIAAPSSYVYFNDERRVPGTVDQFAVPNAFDPNDPDYCPDYNEYGFGMDALNEYMTAVGGANQIRDQYARRDVVYIIGDQDTSSGGLDTRCKANLEGAQRLERMTIYFNYIQHYFGPQILASHRMALLPGIDHSETLCWASACGRRFLFGVETPPGEVLRVDADAAPGGDGSSWTGAFNDLQDALETAAACGGDVTEIWVADGEYKPDRGTGDREMSFPILQGVSLLGGFAGIDSAIYPGGETDRCQRDPQLNVTVLSGDLLGDDGDPNTQANVSTMADNSYHVLLARGVDRTALLDGFLVRRGHASAPNGASARAGGLLIEYADPTVRNVKFIDHVGIWGGAVAIRFAGEPRFEDCTFERSFAGEDGGGVSCSEGDGEFIRCRFLNNEAGDDGGGFRAWLANVLISECVFRGNHAGGNAGGYYDGSAGFAAATIVNCLFTDNVAGNRGGAIANIGESESSFINCTIFRNTALVNGGAIRSTGGTQIFRNCIIRSNSAGGVAAITGPVDIAYSCLRSLFPGPGNVVISPQFVDYNNDDFHLLPTSPMIDAGDNTALPVDSVTDLDGYLRFRDDDATVNTGNGAAPLADIGVYEFPHAPCPGDANSDGLINISDLGLLLANYGGCDSTRATGDLNGDGRVNITDLGELLASFGTYCE